jgi:sugar/nucleoside kinase (ribokinase family)
MSYLNEPGILIIGDAMLDVVAVPETSVADLDYAEASISFQAGGSGVNLALAASDAGFDPVSLVCSLGADEFANGRIEALLRASNVHMVVNQVADQPTGVSIVAYLGNDSRIMLAAPGVNSAEFANRTVDAACGAISDVLVVSGYMLFRRSTRHAVLEIMRHASDRGAMVAVDFVPHSIHREIPMAELRQMLAIVDFVAAEHNTFASLNQFADVLSFASGFLEYEVGAGYRVESRAGVLATGTLRRPASRLELRGMTDRLLIAILRDHLHAIRSSA